MRFSRDKDDLDWYEACHWIDSMIGPVAMMRHENSPASGTLIYVDASVDARIAIDRITTVLALNKDDIVWRCSGDMQQ